MSANPAVSTIEAGQKLISCDEELLSAFDLDGTKIDIYGEWEGDGYVALDAAIAGTRISVWDLMSETTKIYLDSKCNEILPNAMEREEDARADAYERRHG